MDFLPPKMVAWMAQLTTPPRGDSGSSLTDDGGGVLAILYLGGAAVTACPQEE